MQLHRGLICLLFSALAVAPALATEAADPAREFALKNFGASNSAVSAAETVLATVPFRAYKTNSACNGPTCTVTLPSVAPKHRQEITDISCRVASQADKNDIADFSVFKGTSTSATFSGFLPLEIQTNLLFRLYASNQTVFVPVNAGEHLAITVNSEGNGLFVECGVTGSLLTLK